MTTRAICASAGTALLALLAAAPAQAARPEEPMQIAAPAATLFTDAATDAAPFCEGDGQSGSRVQAVYGHIEGTSNTLDRPLIEALAARVDEAYDDSAERQGGSAHPRWALEPGTCNLSILTVQLPAGAPSDFDLTVQVLSDQGLLTHTDRKYMVWVDGSGSEGLIANSPTEENDTNPATQAADGGATAATVAQITRDNWDSRADSSIRFGAQHELSHMLGAVNPGAPHSIPGKHCDDEYDAMCFGPGSATPACLTNQQPLLDCGGDDYFAVSPQPGNYLYDHWNTYASSFLVRSDVADAPPETTLVSGPSGTVRTSSAAFTFAATETGTYECALDGSGFAPCSSPKAYSGLRNGRHRFSVRAVDGAGNRDYSPPARSWTVAVEPETKITQAKVSWKKRWATFTFAGSGGAALSFECRLDSKPFARCASPLTLKRLKPGKHVFAVRAVAGGLADPQPATKGFKVKKPKKKRR